MKRPYLSTLRRPRRWLWSLAVALTMHGCGGEPSGDPVTVVVARGASFNEVVDSLSSSGIIGRRIEPVFRAYGRLRRADRSIHAGHYEFRRGESWSEILSDLTSGNVLTVRLTVPEGFTMERMSIRLAVVSEATPDSVRAVLSESEQLVAQMEVPGPTLEGYLFPDTYFFEPGTRLEEVLGAMVSRYKEYWTPERRAKLAELGMTEKEAVTLASIIQAEAVWTREMPAISSVYHNRLRTGQALYADPTVLYALGGHRERLLYAAIDSVADNPYNTYRNPGLPPGPIGSPGEHALDAALNPEQTRYFYFVARPDGTHVFTESVDQHNAAKARARQEWDTTRSAVGVRGPELDGGAPRTPGPG
jgi:UPF0755 protein